MLSCSNSFGCYTVSLYSQITSGQGKLRGTRMRPASTFLLILEATSFRPVPEGWLLPARNHWAQFICRRQTGCWVLLWPWLYKGTEKGSQVIFSQTTGTSSSPPENIQRKESSPGFTADCYLTTLHWSYVYPAASPLKHSRKNKRTITKISFTGKSSMTGKWH